MRDPRAPDSPDRLSAIRDQARRRRAGLRGQGELRHERAGKVRPGGPKTAAEDTADLRRFFSRGRFTHASDGAPEGVPDTEVKGWWKSLYESINSHINETIFEDDAIFLNYGFVADDSPRWSQVDLPEHFPNRNCVELILELVGDENLTGRDVLEVGCGRGGNASSVDRFFEPRRMIGLDQSFNAVRFCSRRWANERVSFVEGDAEKLPFASASFDALTNVESSCCYPDWPAFLREVHRVLRPGGSFLHTDLFPNDTMRDMIEYLRGLGFVVERDQDISNNVLLSCDEAAQRVAQVYKDYLDETVQAHFVGVPGTSPYDELADGRMSYRIFRLRKPSEGEEGA